MHDMVIKGGTVVDGTGAPSFQADIAIDGGRISEIGRVADGGREVIDADGLLVTPGFVDTHTHYDGQASWDPMLTPSCWHGVTTVTMGNCGVGFAPVRRGREEWLISLMEGVEDIPGTVLSEGMRWEWETFPEYLDFLDGLSLALDVTCQVPHGPLRAYVMGERGASNEPATDEDMARMAALVGEAIEAGAYAFTTSRTLVHKAKDGKCVPGTFATEAEIFAIAEAMKKVGRGVFEVAQLGAAGEGEDPVADTRRELDWMRRVSEYTGQNVVYTLEQVDRVPELWREMLKFTDEANAGGANLRAMTAARPIGALIGFRAAGEGYSPIAYFNPLRFRPSYKALVGLPHDERLARMRDPETKARILGETPAYDNAELGAAFPFGDSDAILARYYPLADPLDYEPDAARSIVGLAAAEGREPMEYFYDRLVADGGETLFLVPLLNYTYGNGDALLEMMKHPANVLGLGDGGAHCQNLCDASNTTYMLTHWVRDRARGERVPLEWAVRKLTLDPAQTWGLHDRGRLAVGLKADLNVIDFANLNILPPRLTADLPAGGSRVLQRSQGYVATINSGQVIIRNSAETEARPGRLVRSGR